MSDFLELQHNPGKRRARNKTEGSGKLANFQNLIIWNYSTL